MRIEYCRCDECGREMSCSVVVKVINNGGDVVRVCRRCDPDLYLHVSEEEKNEWLKGDQNER